MNDAMRTIESVKALRPTSLELRWSTGETARVFLGHLLDDRAFESLRTPETFAKATIGDCGHSITWPDGTELGADKLWLDTLAALGKPETRAFLEWRLRNGLSLSGAATALGMSRRMIAYYSNGARPIPEHVLLACYGWEKLHRSCETQDALKEELLTELTG